MKVTEPEDAQQYSALFDATIRQAVGGAPALMARLVAHVRGALRELESDARDRRERDRLTHARRLLNQMEGPLCERFSEELLNAFNRISSIERPMAAPASTLHFDQVGAMDAAQVREHVESARAQHSVHGASNTTLEELNRLVCALLGLQEVRLERNPLRPSVYMDAVTAALAQQPVPSTIRQSWLSMMFSALGHELGVYYHDLCAELRDKGVGAAAGSLPAAARASARAEPGLLTLEKLRQLLARRPGATETAIAQRYGSVESAGNGESTFADHRAVASDFSPTVPAAFEALRDLNQVEQVAQRVQAREAAEVAPAHTRQHPRDQLRQSAHGLEQLLGLEVVEMMVDNITRDPRLLAPVQRIVADLEPALLQLALVDPRFFSHKQHPARRLLHEITHRSIAFESVDSRGFSGFMEPLQEAVAPLAAGPIATAEPFDQVLERLVALWDAPGGAEQRQLARAVKALQEAEQRNALAATIVADIQGRTDLAQVPRQVIDFLCGPWAQVVAHARITDRSGVADPGDYAQSIEDLIWSAQPHRTASNRPALGLLAPRLLERLHAGLEAIDCPVAGSSEFFDLLGSLHRQAMDPAAQPSALVPEAEQPFPDTGAMPAALGDSVWLAPTEALVSGFIDLETKLRPAAPGPVPVDAFQPGAWVTLLAEDGWTRTRLIWASPQSTLLLFSDALGYMQSLTRRACEQMFADGQLRIVCADPVEDALDAVAQTAMQNSVDIRF
jgi:hypothetical protein